MVTCHSSSNVIARCTFGRYLEKDERGRVGLIFILS